MRPTLTAAHVQYRGTRKHLRHLPRFGCAANLRDAPTGAARNARRRSAARFLNDNFFILGLVGVVTCAKIAPSLGCTGGPLRPELVVGKAAIAAIFFLTGFRTELRDLGFAAKNTRLNALVQGFNLGLLPIVGLGAGKALAALRMSPVLCEGVTAMMCLPTTISMCVVLSQAAGGAAAGAGAAFNAVAGNLLGLVVTPALILTTLPGGVRGEVQLVKSLLQLGSKVVAPLAAGSLLRLVPAARDWQQRYKQPLSRLSEAVLLAIVYNTFCDALVPGKPGGAGALAGVLSPRDAFLLPAALVVLQAASLAAGAAIAHAADLPPQDLPVVMFAGAHKTLSFGIPLLKTMFGGPGSDPVRLAALSAPLLLYHPLELLIGSALVPKLRAKLDAAGVEL
eukprot:TRINITY_DN4815_c0_g1_i3.p1 TRINITY_DN4815_c0_g1~~TRINITY_DN4815_c0_g1_i3.p1  ORF type:complete len:428 (+),score=125.53 TRINITY_DN4815_c0_g1_i3:104-1285(+)